MAPSHHYFHRLSPLPYYFLEDGSGLGGEIVVITYTKNPSLYTCIFLFVHMRPRLRPSDMPS